MLDRATTHKLWIFQYLTPVLVTALYYVLRLAPADQTYWQVLLFLAGCYAGNLILWVDGAFLYPRYNELQTFPQKLLTRSILFVIAFIAVGVFITTSSGSSFGTGIVVGLGISLFGEMVAYLRQPALFQQRFLYQLRRQPTLTEMKGVVIAFGVVMLGLIALLLT